MSSLPTQPANDPAAPTGETLSNVDAKAGDAQFAALEGGRIRCLTCRRELDATDADAESLTRLEGTSDPDDMLAVVPVRCPHCGASGAITLNYGPEAGPEDVDVLVALRRDPSSRTLSSAPDERG